MPGSGLYMSFVDCSFTPQSTGLPVVINKVTDVNFDLASDLEHVYADGSRFTMITMMPRNNRIIKVTGGDVYRLLQFPSLTVGVFRVTLMDAITGRGPGSMHFTLNPCVISGFPFKGATGKYADGEISFIGYSPDGLIDPLSFVLATLE